MSDAETIRAAADHLEVSARNATPGPWRWERWGTSHELVHPLTAVVGFETHPMNVLKCDQNGWPPKRADKDWIALMSIPGLRELTVKWLRDAAHHHRTRAWAGDLVLSDMWALEYAQTLLCEVKSEN